MDLNNMKYAELRSLAKDLGLKANGKADKLLKAITHHFQEMNKLKAEQEQDGGKVQEQGKKQESEDSVQDAAVCKEKDSDIDLFVTKRRGRENSSKRKLPDAAAACDANVTSKVDAQSKPCSAQGRKKRKLYPDESSERTGSEPQRSGSDRKPSDTKDEEPAHRETETVIKVVKGGKIPRYQRLLQNKASTPNFKKIHEAQFDKMESIATYVQRKSKQTEANKHPVQQVKKMNPRGSIFSPAPPNKQSAEGKNRQTLPNKPTEKKDTPFRLSVHLSRSSRRINVRFSAATCDNEFKGSLVKTPSRMSPYVDSSTPHGRAAEPGKGLSVRTSNFSAQKPPGPFVFTGNTSVSATPGAQKKMTFDLKSSLSRPLTYKPHKGKLKPFGEVKENTSANKSLVSNPRQQTYKQHKVQTREDRRTKQTEERRQKKESLLGARRGLVMK